MHRKKHFVNNMLKFNTACLQGEISKNGAGMIKAFGLIAMTMAFLIVNCSSATAQIVSGYTVTSVASVTMARGVSTDAEGNVYTMERDGGKVYKIEPNGFMSEIVDLEIGPDVFSGYIGPHYEPVSGNIYVCKVYGGDGTEILQITRQGEVATLNTTPIPSPSGLTSDTAGNLYVATFFPNGEIYKVTPNGSVSLFATGLNFPDGLVFGPGGDLFVGQRGTNQIMRVPSTGNTPHVASVYNIDNATESPFNLPLGIAYDGNGKLYVANFGTGTGTGTISIVGVVSDGRTLAGVTGTGFTSPDGLAFDPSGNLFVADYGANQIFKISPEAPPEIVLNGISPVILEYGEEYIDAGVEVTDDTDPQPGLTTEGEVNTSELGEYIITYTATDASGNTATATRTVQVVDTIAPSLTIQYSSITNECAGPNGTFVDLGSVTADDACDPAPAITNDAPPKFLMGVTEVTWTATDASGNSTSGIQLVTIVDTTSPDLTVPGDITAEATSPDGASVDLDPEGSANASDICDPSPSLVNNGLSVYPLGSTTVTWTASDASGNVSDGAQIVNVVDTTPPVVAFALSTGSLWPPNHKMVQVASGISASDIADENPSVVITVTSDEDINGTGDGNTEVDWEVIDGNVYLRAERDGGQDGRVYTVTVVATDAAGNTTTVTGTVDVPHGQEVASADNGKGKGKAKKLVVVSQSVTPSIVVGEAKVIAGQSSGTLVTQGESVTIVGAGPVVADQLIDLSGNTDVAPRMQDVMVQNHTFSLSQNHPNPFNPETVIGYALSEGSDVRLVIYNVLGQQVRELVNNAQSAGSYTVRWDGRDALGRQVTSGVYIYRLVAGSQVEMRKMILLK